MNTEAVLAELESLAKPAIKKRYLNNGAHEPLFGVGTGAMKPMAKKLMGNQALAEELYDTGNYDAMYFAGVIADAKAMTREDFNRWMNDAYFFMLSDYVVAVTLSESPLAQEVADEWIQSNQELIQSAGWSCYCWLLGSQKDENFDEDKIKGMLNQVEETIHEAPDRAKASMNNFVYTVAISYKPLHDEAVQTAERIGPVTLDESKKSLNPSESIQKDVDKGRVGFKRRYVRC